MNTNLRRLDQSELSNVPRRHGGSPLEGALVLIASQDIPAGVAVAISGEKQGKRVSEPGTAIGISLSSAERGQRFAVATPGMQIKRPNWNWSPGRVNYTPSGYLTQGAGQQIAVAFSHNELLVTSPSGFLGGAGGGAFTTDDFIVSADDLLAKQVPLSDMPFDPLKVELSVYGGIEQQPGIDFVVTGQTLSWDGLALELLLEIGTSFSVRYAT